MATEKERARARGISAGLSGQDLESYVAYRCSTAYAKHRDRLYQEWEGRCQYCNGALEDGWHIDHVVPKSSLPHVLEKFGLDGTTLHQPINLVPSCPPCNTSKNDVAGAIESYVEQIATSLDFEVGLAGNESTQPALKETESTGSAVTGEMRGWNNKVTAAMVKTGLLSPPQFELVKDLTLGSQHADQQWFCPTCNVPGVFQGGTRCQSCGQVSRPFD